METVVSKNGDLLEHCMRFVLVMCLFLTVRNLIKTSLLKHVLKILWSLDDP